MKPKVIFLYTGNQCTEDYFLLCPLGLTTLHL